MVDRITAQHFPGLGLGNTIAYVSEDLIAHQPDTPARFILQALRGTGEIDFTFAFMKESFGFRLTMQESVALIECIQQALLTMIGVEPHRM